MKTLVLLMLLYGATAIAQEDIEPLESDEGYLLVEISHSGFRFTSISIDGGGTIGIAREFRREDFDPSTNFQLIKLKAGQYYWRRINLLNRRYYSFGKTEFPMTVKAGYINYGGMFLARSRGSNQGSFKVLNRVTPAIAYLETCCSDLLQQLPFNYGAPGVDPFVDFYFSLPAKVEEQEVTE